MQLQKQVSTPKPNFNRKFCASDLSITPYILDLENEITFTINTILNSKLNMSIGYPYRSQLTTTFNKVVIGIFEKTIKTLKAFEKAQCQLPDDDLQNLSHKNSPSNPVYLIPIADDNFVVNINRDYSPVSSVNESRINGDLYKKTQNQKPRNGAPPRVVNEVQVPIPPPGYVYITDQNKQGREKLQEAMNSAHPIKKVPVSPKYVARISGGVHQKEDKINVPVSPEYIARMNGGVYKKQTKEEQKNVENVKRQLQAKEEQKNVENVKRQLQAKELQKNVENGLKRQLQAQAKEEQKNVENGLKRQLQAKEEQKNVENGLKRQLQEAEFMRRKSGVTILPSEQQIPKMVTQKQAPKNVQNTQNSTERKHAQTPKLQRTQTLTQNSSPERKHAVPKHAQNPQVQRTQNSSPERKHAQNPQVQRTQNSSPERKNSQNPAQRTQRTKSQQQVKVGMNTTLPVLKRYQEARNANEEEKRVEEARNRKVREEKIRNLI